MGAVGMILAGVGAYLGVAFLVVGGWIALTVAIWRTNFFEGRAKRVQWFGNLFISLLVAAVLIVIVMFLQPKMPNPFNAEMRVVMGSPDAGPLSYYMVGYPSSYGQTVSPVCYLTYITLTNLQDVSSSISEFQVAVAKEPSGPWENLPYIHLQGYNLYALVEGTPAPTKMQLAPGTYYLDAPLTIENMRRAEIVFAEPTLEAELAKPIPPHQTIRGWVALDFPPKREMGDGDYFQITLHDTADKVATCVTRLPSREPNDSSMHVDSGIIQATGQLADISGFKVKYYSEPVPQR